MGDASVDKTLPPSPRRRLVWLQRGSRSRHQYTLAKFADSLEYAQRTSRWRHALVVLLTPAPSLCASLLAPLVPLQDPRLGIRHNAGFLASFFLNFLMVVVGSVLQVRGSTGLTRRDMSNTDVFLIALADAALSTAIVAAAAAIWRFPVPFSIVTLFLPMLLAFIGANVAVLRGRLLGRDSTIRGPLLGFLPSFAIQAGQVVAYTALSAAFTASSEFAQVALVALFPVVKYGVRIVIRRFARLPPDHANESVVGGVEIAAAMYQSTLMQGTSSATATALLMALDALQSSVTVFVFMATDTNVPSREILRQAADIMDKTPSTTHKALIPPAGTRVHPTAPRAVVASTRTPPPVLTHALEILHTAESLVLIEYLEVALPVMNIAFLCAASQLQTAEYNPKLRGYRHRPLDLERALGSLALYAGLQALSLVALHVILWRRYRLPTTALLAFVLERHVWALQGKLIAWLALMFQLPVLHYGFDFTFRFAPTLPPLE